MKQFIIFFLVYLLVVMWAQIDNGRVPLKRAAFNTFVAPYIYFFLGIPFSLYVGAVLAYRWARAVFSTRE